MNEPQSLLRRLQNETGAALLLGLLVLTVLITLMAGFALSTVQEIRGANRYRDGAIAFWLAEAGVQRFMEDTTILNSGSQTVYFGSNYFTLSKDDTDSTLRVVTAVGHVGGITRNVRVEFPANPPVLFDNTMSTGGNLNLAGLFARMDVYGKTRISGTYNKTGIGATGWFEDKQTGVASNSTTLKYPDSDNSGTADQFNDFVQFNRTLVAAYPSSEVLYIQSNSTQVIVPSSSLAGKKVIYVEGTTAGSGDVNIVFGSTWQDNQNMTVISTGNIAYLQPLQISSNSQLNTISWDDYNEASVFYSTHDGVTYSHDDANFYSIFEYSETTGNVVANHSIGANEALSWKKFNYGNPLNGSTVPPGFEGLVSQANSGYSSTPSEWKEI